MNKNSLVFTVITATIAGCIFLALSIMLKNTICFMAAICIPVLIYTIASAAVIHSSENGKLPAWVKVLDVSIAVVVVIGIGFIFGLKVGIDIQSDFNAMDYQIKNGGLFPVSENITLIEFETE